MLNILMKEDLNLNENLNEFLKEWEYHTSVLSSINIIDIYGFTKDPNTSKYMVVMDYANKDLMKECWNEDSSKRPSSKEVLEIIEKWIFRPDDDEINEELESNIMEFINAPIGHNNLATKSHPKACFTSRLLDFTSKKLNEILENENTQASHASHSDLNDCVIRGDLMSLDENTSKKLNEIPESENSQASVKANEMLVSEDLNDYIIKGLGSLDIKANEN
ncbi:kinase-like domain-containing protein [Rhizophagus irregularis DAOM 181602=DAOM 197198]|nr:kinase-like domain-containing protein [Rhizophagus irregularis DAOM 181602=DAOM 197198]